MFVINDKLATHGLGDDYYPTPEEHLQTGMTIDSFGTLGKTAEWTVVDVRDMLDGSGNNQADYAAKIHEVIKYILLGKKAVVCCGAGQSRSNAIALGVLVKHFGMDFYDAFNLIDEKVPISQIDISHIASLKRLFSVTLP